MNRLQKNQNGAVDLMVIVLLIVVIVIGGVVIWRVNDSTTNSGSDDATALVSKSKNQDSHELTKVIIGPEWEINKELSVDGEDTFYDHSNKRAELIKYAKNSNPQYHFAGPLMKCVYENGSWSHYTEDVNNPEILERVEDVHELDDCNNRVSKETVNGTEVMILTQGGLGNYGKNTYFNVNDNWYQLSYSVSIEIDDGALTEAEADEIYQKSFDADVELREMLENLIVTTE